MVRSTSIKLQIVQPPPVHCYLVHLRLRKKPTSETREKQNSWITQKLFTNYCTMLLSTLLYFTSLMWQLTAIRCWRQNAGLANRLLLSVGLCKQNFKKKKTLFHHNSLAIKLYSSSLQSVQQLYYRLDDPEYESLQGKRFFCSPIGPDWQKGPLSLLFNRYRGFFHRD